MSFCAARDKRGTWVPGSTVIQNGNAGSFQLNDQAPAGILLPSPLTVLTAAQTVFNQPQRAFGIVRNDGHSYPRGRIHPRESRDRQLR